MTPEDYSAQQLAITAAIAYYVEQFSTMFQQQALTPAGWVRFLELIFPEVQQRRRESAELARFFYDSVREYHHPSLPRNDRLIDPYEFEWFVDDMEPARRRMSQEGAPRDAVSAVALRAIRAVENGGRRQIIHAVENDDAVADLVANQSRIRFTEEQTDESGTRVLGYNGQPVSRVKDSLVRGWARVATGRETCAWCLMLISRGPTYLSAKTSGLDLDDESAQAMIAAGTDVSKYMDDWHAGCDCKVVPVFKQQDWIGSEAAKRAKDAWDSAAIKARSLQSKDGPKRHKTGRHKGSLVSHNEETINLLRRRLYAGELNPADFAGLSAAA